MFKGSFLVSIYRRKIQWYLSYHKHYFHFFLHLRQSLGELPIVEDEMRKAAGEEDLEDESVAAASGGNTTKLVTADGTYATQSAFSTASEKKGAKMERPPLREDCA